MSSDKHSKKDLEKKVSRLKQKIGAVDKRLDQQTRGYEKLRKRFKSLRQNDALQEDIAGLHRRLDEWSGEAGPEAFKALSEGHFEQGRRMEELVKEVQALQKSLSRQTDQGTSLVARTQELEAYAADLSRARREQQESLKALGRDAAGLQEQSNRLEQRAAGLAERTQALEAASEKLVRHDGAHASQLQADEQVLETLRTQVGTLTDSVSALERQQEWVNQQVSTLETGQERSRAHLDELLARAETLETGALKHGERIEDFAKQLAALSEEVQGLLALDAGRRFADLDMRSDALGESLGEHRTRLGALEQGNEGLGQRLGTVIEDTEALIGRVKAQGSNSEKLGEELDDQGSRLSGQQHALNELGRDLAEKHARQNAETEELEQRVRQRSLLGLMLLLLLAGLTGFLFLKPYMMRAEPVVVVAEQAAPRVMQPQSEDEVQGLQQDIAELRSGLARLDGSVTEIRQSTERGEPSMTSDLPAQVAALVAAEVAQLRSELTRLERSVAEVDESIERVDARVDPELADRVAALAGTLETLSRERLVQQQQSAELLAGQEQASAEIKAIARDTEMLQSQLAQTAVLQGLAEYGKHQDWLKAQQLGFYTIQLVGAYQRQSLARFIRQQGIESDSAIHTTRYRGRKWYVLFYGTFDSLSQARSAARELPKALAEQRPWVRRIPGSGELLPL